MGTKLFVRNLATSIDSSTLEDLFTTIGDVKSAIVRLDLINGVQRRVGYVEMTTEEQAQNCIEFFHGQMKDGLALVVTEDKPHVPDPNAVKVKKRKVQPPAKPKGRPIKWTNLAQS